MSTPVFSIGFTKTSAKHFFERLQKSGVRKIIDVRLHNKSQLAGFAKSDDLSYFLDAIGGMAYQHIPLLAPEEAPLANYRAGKIDWAAYESKFLDLMAVRRIEERMSPQLLEGACLLCSEDTPHQCHRRLVLDYLNKKWDSELQVRHL